ncbi:MAG: ABC transporter permease [Planctomycetota bacterium]|nr:MAG: ABC transporter permease [Planctomycetota bacterium]
MTQATMTIDNLTEPLAGRSLWADAVTRLRRDRLAMICFCIIAAYVLIAIVSPIAFGSWSNSQNYDNVNAAPSASHWLGTDTFGRDVLQKTLLGASTSMTVGFMANIIAVPLGMFLGAVAGYYGGWVDDIIVWLYTTLTCIPGIILLIVLKFAFAGRALLAGTPLEMDLGGMAGTYLALGVISWIGTCRLVRAETMRLREMDYVLASRASGRGPLAILLRHILPNVTHLGIINFSLGFVGAIKAEVILSYLGLGVTDRPSWGKMIDAARMDVIVGRWWELASAVVAMFIIVLAWSIFGDRLRDALDPKLKNT